MNELKYERVAAPEIKYLLHLSDNRIASMQRSCTADWGRRAQRTLKKLLSSSDLKRSSPLISVHLPDPLTWSEAARGPSF